MNTVIVVLPLYFFFLFTLIATCTSQLLVLPRNHIQDLDNSVLGKFGSPAFRHQTQQPFNMPPADTAGDDTVSPMLSDVISIDRAISIFSGFTRSVETAGNRLEDRLQNTTVLAPANSYITSLPRKPWESPDDEHEASAQGTVKEELYRGEGGEDRAAENLRRFVEAHLVGISPWEPGVENKQRTLEGKIVWWNEENGVRTIYPDGIEVASVKYDVSNGQIWVIKGVINY